MVPISFSPLRHVWVRSVLVCGVDAPGVPRSGRCHFFWTSGQIICPTNPIFLSLRLLLDVSPGETIAVWQEPKIETYFPIYTSHPFFANALTDTRSRGWWKLPLPVDV